jgi:hypothetical protein
MDIILLILVFTTLFGVAKAIQAMRDKKAEKSKLKARLGDDYDAFIQMRKKKPK